MLPSNIEEALNGKEVVVYLDENWDIDESFIVTQDTSEDEILKMVNDRYGVGGWYEYFIY